MNVVIFRSLFNSWDLLSDDEDFQFFISACVIFLVFWVPGSFVLVRLVAEFVLEKRYHACGVRTV